VRAIGDPAARIAEDKLRMLRAARFAARFDFVIEHDTLSAIKRQAHELVIVSAERVAAELRQILTHASRARGLELLVETGLLEIVLPESATLLADGEAWPRALAVLTSLQRPTFAMALATLLREIHFRQPDKNLPQAVADRWKLSNDEFDGVHKLLGEERLIRTARQQPWPKLQRVLIAPRAAELLGYAEAVARVIDGSVAEIEFCREKLALPSGELNPPPLITGDDLKQHGIPPGPRYRELLETIRDLQLERQVTTKDQAIERVHAVVARASSP